MKKTKADQTHLLAELRQLECKPPKRADRLVARHLKCEESQSLAHAVAEAAGDRRPARCRFSKPRANCCRH